MPAAINYKEKVKEQKGEGVSCLQPVDGGG